MCFGPEPVSQAAADPGNRIPGVPHASGFAVIANHQAAMVHRSLAIRNPKYLRLCREEPGGLLGNVGGGADGAWAEARGPAAAHSRPFSHMRCGTGPAARGSWPGRPWGCLSCLTWTRPGGICGLIRWAACGRAGRRPAPGSCRFCDPLSAATARSGPAAERGSRCPRTPQRGVRPQTSTF